MTTDTYSRKLTTIFSADVAGYSRLMGEDEAATVKTLTSYRKILADLIRQHRGRVIDSPGDNLLAEFTSVVDAVQCAVAVQNEFKSRNAELPPNRKMEFRIGINLGDVIEEEDRIYGDGVNVAARLEGLADPGGICISKTAFDQIETKLPLGYEFLGEQEVKNIAKPVGAYRVLMEPRVIVADTKGEEKAKALTVWRRKAILGGSAAVALGIIIALIWQFYLRPPPIEQASVEKMAYPLPDKPSIVVLPFKNLGGDSQPGPLSNAITENIITALSKTPKIFVIASNSVSMYRDKPVKIRELSEELGVRYILEGSVLRSENQLRISVLLIDAIKGRHIWAEKYDRTLNDLFAVQDEITMKIIAGMQLKLTEGEQARLYEKGTDNLEAYLKVLQSIDYRRHHNPEDNAKARQLAQEAIVLDPHYPMAYAVLGRTHYMATFFGETSPEEDLRRAEGLANKALSLDDSLAEAHSLLGHVYLGRGEYNRAITEYERAVKLNPTGADELARLARGLRYVDRYDEAIPLLKKAIRLNPNSPSWYFNVLCSIYRDMANYGEAITWCKKQVERDPENLFGHLYLCSAYSLANRMEEARAEAAEVLTIQPTFSVAHWKETGTKTDPDRKGPFLDSLRKAGLPENPPLPLPDKPSIAVLPFENMSGDPEQEYFSDGLTEEIITALSKTPKLFVIARNSSFTYKGKPVWIPTVGKELGVKYVLEGSVRKAGDKVRVTAQLIDAQTNNHIWAERYDRELKDIFAVQDDITKNIITSVQVKLTRGEQGTISAEGTKNLDAYLYYLRAWDYLWQFNQEDNTKARHLAEKAIALDPNYDKGYSVLAFVEIVDVWLGASKSPEEALKRCIGLAKKSIAIRDSPIPHRVLAGTYLLFKKNDAAMKEAKKAIDMNPNYADAYMTLGQVSMLSDMEEDAVRLLQKAIRLNPFPPSSYYCALAWSYFWLRRYDEAIAEGKRAISVNPKDFLAHLGLVCTYLSVDREEEARVHAEQVLKIDPNFSVNKAERTTPLKDKTKLKTIMQYYRMAGLPD